MNAPGRREVSDPQNESGGLRFVTLESRVLGGRGDLTLFVPLQSEGKTDVPLVALLHGVYGSHWAWAFKGGAHHTAARLMASGEIPPMILVMPSDGLWAEGSGYLPQESGDYERWIVEDVLEGVQATLPQVTAASKHFIAGFSMGGWGALRLGAKYPHLFSGVSAHSSVTTLDAYDALLTRPASYAPGEERHVAHWLARAGPQLPPLRFDCGIDDKYLDDNRALHHFLLAHQLPHHYAEFPGGHTWDYWAAHLEDTLRFFGSLA